MNRPWRRAARREGRGSGLVDFLWFFLALAAAVLLLGRLFLGAEEFYRRLYQEEHIEEFAALVGEVRAKALEKIFSDSRRPASPQEITRATTSAGLVYVHSVCREGDEYRHHLSWSRQGERLTKTAALVYIRFSLLLLGISETPEVGLSQNGRYHVAFALDEEGERVFSGQSSEPLERKDLLALFARAVVTSREVPVRRITISEDGGGPAAP